MKQYLFILLLFTALLFTFVACEKEDFYNTKSDDLQEMSSLRKEIDKLSEQVACENGVDWKFTAIGAKGCGGAAGYIAYSTKIDEALFLKKVALYNQKQKAFNVKWNIISDCAVPAPPKSIDCVSGKPKFVY